jgi:2-polyprenyl-6-methoxyphenol hydroxylase-like FAD-dependent oxidoreductase
MAEKVGDRAVVLGGSITGLFAAQALAGSYSEVVIVDRDKLLGVTGMRRSTPQSFHAQALLARGQQALEDLFPGITGEFSDAGVPTGDVGGDLRWFVNGRRLKPVHTGLVCLSTPRLILESHVRERVRALPNVVFLEQCDILGLETTADRSRVTGARVLRQAEGSTEEVLRADVVLDATGRGSRVPVWLEELGYLRPDEERLKIGLGYATRHYRLPLGLLGTDLGVVVVPTPAHPRGALFSREHPLPDGGERYLVTLNGMLGDHPPTDPQGFLDFAKSLPVPKVFASIRDAEPLDDAIAYLFPASRWRHYERLTRFPEGLLVMGDGICVPNPVYAQAITIAAIQGVMLRDRLRAGSQPDGREFFRVTAPAIQGAWEITTAGDLSYPGVEGRRTPQLRMASAYITRLRSAAVYDGALTRAFLRVAGLIDPPQTLMRPRTLLRVLRYARRSRKFASPSTESDRAAEVIARASA